jgi:hypothetical protein
MSCGLYSYCDGGSVIKTAGFYQENNPNLQISREPTHIWSDLTRGLDQNAKRQLASNVIGISDNDYECISTCILENIKYVIDHAEEPVLCHEEKKRFIPQFDKKITDESSVSFAMVIVPRHHLIIRVGVDSAQNLCALQKVAAASCAKDNLTSALKCHSGRSDVMSSGGF